MDEKTRCYFNNNVHGCATSQVGEPIRHTRLRLYFVKNRELDEKTPARSISSSSSFFFLCQRELEDSKELTLSTKRRKREEEERESTCHRRRSRVVVEWP